MKKSLVGWFDSRRDSEMTIEQLVQVLGIDRTDVFVASAEAENTAGVVKAGSDTEEGEPDPDAHPALEGQIEVSVDVDEARLADAEAVFRDHGARRMERR